SWHISNPDEHAKKDERTNSIPWVGDHETAHNGGDGSARTEIRNGRRGVYSYLRAKGCQPTKQIEQQISRGSHGIFELRSERPEVNHVPDDVAPTCVHEHCRQNRNEVVARADLPGDDGPLLNELIAAREFQ